MSTMAVSADAVARATERLRAKTPRVHCLTNAVAQAFTANVLLALGAIPSMTIAREEVADFVADADALLVNLGTLDPERQGAIEVALPAAERAGLPWVLDPVFADASLPRLGFAQGLLNRRPTVLRANGGELAALSGARDAEAFAGATGVTVALTGAEDVISDGVRTTRIVNGDPMLTRITATGCAAGAVVAAFLAVEPDPVVAATSALAVFGVAADMAGEASGGPGSFAVALLDALYSLDGAALSTRARIS